MFQLNLFQAKSILCLGAHSDDIEIGCGGMLLSLLEANPSLKVDWVVWSASPERKAEAEAGFELWCENRDQCRLHVFDFPDSLFPWHGIELKKAFHEFSKSVKPDLVFTHRRDDAHQDHRMLAELTWNAYRDHLILEYEIPKYEGDLGQPNIFFPLTKKIADQKIEYLIKAFATQQEKPWFLPTTFQALMHLRGIECKAPEGCAEAFHARKLSVTTQKN